MTTVSFFLSKLLASLIRNYFPNRTSCASLHNLSKLYDVPVGFVTPSLLRQCIAIFAVAEGWLLLDIGWFVLFLFYQKLKIWLMFQWWKFLNTYIYNFHAVVLEMGFSKMVAVLGICLTYLLTWIYYCRLGWMVNFTRPSTTNEMISISTSHTFHSWVVIFHLRQPMAFLSLNLYDTPGLALCMDVLFQDTFQ